MTATDSTLQRQVWDHLAPVDEKWMWTRSHRGRYWVYFIIDVATDEVLYIGSSANLVRRSSAHHSTNGYRREAVRYELEGPFKSRLAAEIRESTRIAQLRPPGNIKP